MDRGQWKLTSQTVEMNWVYHCSSGFGVCISFGAIIDKEGQPEELSLSVVGDGDLPVKAQRVEAVIRS